MLKDEIDGLCNRAEDVKQRLIKFIEVLPDADCFHKLGPNCGTVSIHDVAKHNGILSPAYYLSFDLKKLLIESINNICITKMNKFIEGIIKNQSYIASNGHREIIRPDIIQKIKEMWYGKK